MSGFSGTFDKKLDPKGRVLLPKEFKRLVPVDSEGVRTVVLSPGVGNVINLFTPESWAQVRQRMQSEPYGTRQAMMMQRFVLGNTFEIQLDSSSRLLIPERQREYAGLAEEASPISLVGVDNRVELWNTEAWIAFEAEARESFDELAAGWAAGAQQPAAAQPAQPGAGAGPLEVR